MSRVPSAAFRSRASFRERRTVYHALAHHVAGALGPAGVLCEAVATDPRPWAIVRPATVLADLARSGGAGPGTTDYRSTPAPPAPLAGSFERYGVLVPLRAGGRGSPDSVPLAAPTLEQLLGARGWLGVQTFWLRSPGGNLWVARRFRYAAPNPEERDARFAGVAAALAYDWAMGAGNPAHASPSGWGAGRAWQRRSLSGIPRAAWIECAPDSAEPTAELRWIGPPAPVGPPAGHAVVFGASGAGKTMYL
ncbi:MAG: hypothetical protein ACREDE_08075, partial [Thermoplasmata archaeon]